MSSPRRSNSFWLGVLAVLAAASHGLPGCGRPPVAFRAATAEDAGSGTGGAAPATGGAMMVSEPEGSGGRASGGAGGTGGKKVDAGSSAGQGGADASGAGGSTTPAEDAAATGGVGMTGGAGGAVFDAAAGGTAGADAAGSGGTGGTATGGQSGTPDASRPISNGPAACNPDPKVIRICKQLEPACQNCPDRNIWDECFRVSAAGNDTACARYAVDNRCTVDQGGNWCGSLDCTAQGCPSSNCRQVQGNGASAPCQALLDECPCQ